MPDPAVPPSGEPPRGFPEAEFRARTGALQARMADRGLHAVLLTTEPEVRYFSGFLSRFWQSPTRPWFLVVPASGKPVAVIPGIGAEAFAATWLDDVRTWPSPRPADEGVSLLADTLAELAGRRARIGLLMGPETHLRMPLADLHRLEARLGGAVFEDVTDMIAALRMVKSPAEIAKIARACAAAGRAFAALPGLVAPGLPETEVFRRFRIACLEAGADEVSYLVGGAGPGGYRSIISPPTDRPLARGDVLILDTGCEWDGYFCDFDRNFAVGAAPAEAAAAHARLVEAAEAGRAAARPGARAADVFAAMREIVQGPDDAGGGGAESVGRMGHGLGMQLTEWPSLAPGDETLLAENMVLTLEPAVALGGGRMMVHEENIALTASGARLLTDPAGPEMPVIGP